MSFEIVKDHCGFELLLNGTPQSWVNLEDPTELAYEYVQRIAEALEATVLTRPISERIRVIHLGGGAMTLPRYLAHIRPHTAQIVCEPDEELTAEVRRLIPLPRNSGIKVRAVDGRTGLAAMPADYADCLILDAFVGVQVPQDLVTEEAMQEVARVLRPGGIFAANLSGRAPFDWAKRCLAGVRTHFRHLAVSADPATWRGRRLGNLVAIAADQPLPVAALTAAARRAPLPYTLVSGRELLRWLSGAEPFQDPERMEGA